MAAVVALACATSADAARAAAVPFTSAIALEFPLVSPIVLPGSGTVIVNGSNGPGHLTSLEMPATAFNATGVVNPITDPGAFPINGLQLTGSNGAGTFSGSGGAGFGGSLPLAGAAKVCLYGACGASTNITNLTVPLSVVGQPGTAFVKGAINLTVVGAPWTTGTATIMHAGGGTSTRMGGVDVLSATDTVTLVTPVFISTNIQSFAIWPVFATMTLTNLFVPEPGTFGLLVAGLVGLAGCGRARMRRR